MVLSYKGLVSEGLELLRLGCEINKGWYIYYGPYLLKYGSDKEARQVLNELKAFPETPFFNLALAGWYNEAGDLDKAYEYLIKGKRHAWYPWMVRIYLANDAMQQDPRYYNLLKELKLPAPAPLEYDPDI